MQMVPIILATATTSALDGCSAQPMSTDIMSQTIDPVALPTISPCMYMVTLATRYGILVSV